MIVQRESNDCWKEKSVVSLGRGRRGRTIQRAAGQCDKKWCEQLQLPNKQVPWGSAISCGFPESWSKHLEREGREQHREKGGGSHQSRAAGCHTGNCHAVFLTVFLVPGSPR